MLETCNLAFDVLKFDHSDNYTPDDHNETIKDWRKFQVSYKLEHQLYYYNYCPNTYKIYN